MSVEEYLTFEEFKKTYGDELADTIEHYYLEQSDFTIDDIHTRFKWDISIARVDYYCGSCTQWYYISRHDAKTGECLETRIFKGSTCQASRTQDVEEGSLIKLIEVPNKPKADNESSQ